METCLERNKKHLKENETSLARNLRGGNLLLRGTVISYYYIYFSHTADSHVKLTATA